MPEQSWSDLAALRSVSVGRDGVTVVLADSPHLAWTVQCAMHEGRPRVVRYTLAVVGGVAYLDETAAQPPYTTLAAVWARALGVGPDDTAANVKRRLREASEQGRALADAKENPDDHPEWDQFPLLDPVHFRSPKLHLGKKPDKRTARKDPDGYAAAMHEWSKPIAQVVREAVAQGYPIQSEVARRLAPGDKPYSSQYAERLIAWARKPGGHDLPGRSKKENSP